MKYEYLLQTPSLCFGCVSLYLTYDHLLQFIQICGSAVCFNQHKNFTCLVCQDKQSFLKKKHPTEYLTQMFKRIPVMLSSVLKFSKNKIAILRIMKLRKMAFYRRMKI